MTTYSINAKLDRIERKVDIRMGNELDQAFEEVHHDVKLALRLRIKVMIAERAEDSTGEGVLDNETRAMVARELREEDARYRATSAAEYFAGLPTSYVCGKCGATVAFDLDKMLRLGSVLPACACRVAATGT